MRRCWAAVGVLTARNSPVKLVAPSKKKKAKPQLTECATGGIIRVVKQTSIQPHNQSHQTSHQEHRLFLAPAADNRPPLTTHATPQAMRVLQAQSSSSQLAASNTSNSRSPFVSGTARAAASRRTNVVVRGSASADKVTSTSSNSDQISRRELGFGLAATASVAQLLTTAMPAVAEGETAAAPAPASAAPAPAPSTYVDPEDAFKLIVPADWAQTEVRSGPERPGTHIPAACQQAAACIPC